MFSGSCIAPNLEHEPYVGRIITKTLLSLEVF